MSPKRLEEMSSGIASGKVRLIHSHPKEIPRAVSLARATSDWSGSVVIKRQHCSISESILLLVLIASGATSSEASIFYPLAGWYVKEGLFIDCNDQGVELVRAKVTGQIDQLLQGEFDVDLLGRLSEFPLVLAGNPQVVIQVNMFECGGLVIGLGFTHKLGDMCTMATFMTSWSTTCWSRIHEVGSPYFELSSLFPVKGLVLTHWPPLHHGVKFTLNRFVFSGAALSRLKLGATKNARILRVEVFVVCQSMNLRGRVNLPVPTNAIDQITSVQRSKLQ
ncbi:acetyl-CoA-benzylalcohol acetyltransferase-like [Rhodamnia argentea]|uniref:Acetyl-CoA-benzylalcohol acetyltransferase-like n=1 Tax=Rhodamnia argentea TaxID=178133 RepID=A0ABM3HG67_9MYRT|nr:acetyl-CoA-benzylalcohol acetyltransferase-like [Rhodamnia argentea]